MSCFILLEFSILYFVSRAVWIALICVAGLFFHSAGAYCLSFFCAMWDLWVLHTGAQPGKPMESRINPFSKTCRYVPHTWAVCTGTGKQRGSAFCSTPGHGIISKTSSMPVWVARDSNLKVRGVQQNRERPLRRDRAREELLERERETL